MSNQSTMSGQLGIFRSIMCKDWNNNSVIRKKEFREKRIIVKSIRFSLYAQNLKKKSTNVLIKRSFILVSCELTCLRL